MFPLFLRNHLSNKEFTWGHGPSCQSWPKRTVFLVQDTWDNEVSDTRALPRSKPQRRGLRRFTRDGSGDGIFEAENGKVCTTKLNKASENNEMILVEKKCTAYRYIIYVYINIYKQYMYIYTFTYIYRVFQRPSCSFRSIPRPQAQAVGYSARGFNFLLHMWHVVFFVGKIPNKKCFIQMVCGVKELEPTSAFQLNLWFLIVLIFCSSKSMVC